MSMAELMESITDELTEQLGYDASQREIKQDSEMSLVEFAEKIAPFPLSEFQKQSIREYEECEKRNLPLCHIPPRNVGRDFIYQLIEEWKRQHYLTDARCSKCNRLLGKFNGQAEIKCPKCGKINRIGVNLPKDKVFDFLETEKRISQERINEYAECFDGVPVNDHTRKELLKSHIRFCDRILKLLN